MSWPTAGAQPQPTRKDPSMIVILLVFVVSLVMIAIAFVNNRRL